MAAAAHHAASTVALFVLELAATERAPTLCRVGVRRAELEGGAAPRAALRHRRVDASLWRQVKRHGTTGPAVAWRDWASGPAPQVHPGRLRGAARTGGPAVARLQHGCGTACISTQVLTAALALSMQDGLVSSRPSTTLARCSAQFLGHVVIMNFGLRVHSPCDAQPGHCSISAPGSTTTSAHDLAQSLFMNWGLPLHSPARAHPSHSVCLFASCAAAAQKAASAIIACSGGWVRVARSPRR